MRIMSIYIANKSDTYLTEEASGFKSRCRAETDVGQVQNG